MQSLICYFTELFSSVFVQTTVVRIRVRESLCGGKHDHEYLISFFHLLFHYFVIKWIQVTYHGHSDIQKYDELPVLSHRTKFRQSIRIIGVGGTIPTHLLRQ